MKIYLTLYKNRPTCDLKEKKRYFLYMKAKTPSQSSINDYAYRIFPNDLNSHGTAFGGMIMAILDRIASIVAERHSGRDCVTVCVDSLTFLAPAKHGEILVFKASITRSWNTSMEIGVKVLSESINRPEKIHIVSAHFVFVALDDEGNTTAVPPVHPETNDEKRRFENAEVRRTSRIQVKRKTHSS